MGARLDGEAAGRHEATAATHDELATQWEADGDQERARLERRSAELERMAAELERDRAALTEHRTPRPDLVGCGEVPPPLRDKTDRAVEILRGTTYDFRVEATIDVASLFGPDVLVAALERLDAEIEPRPAQ